MNMNIQQLIGLITQRAQNTQVLKSFSLPHPLVSQQTFNSYSPQLKSIYCDFFDKTQKSLQIKSILPFKPVKTRVPVCNKHFRFGDPVYRCFDCFIHESAVLCKQCFEAGDHQGHRFNKIESGGGNCDCGNCEAMRESGFCVHHSGKVEIPIIEEQSRAEFVEIVGEMFRWMLQMKKNSIGYFEIFTKELLGYLTQLNRESIHYNVLTSNLLTSPRILSNPPLCLLDQLFTIRVPYLVQALNELYFALFNLQQFKLSLAIAYLDAYNTVPQIQTSPFHSLYIQLFANDQLVIEVSRKYGKTFEVKKNNYSYETLLEDIGFLRTLRIDPAVAFYQTYFEKNKYIPFNPLDEIEEKYQNDQQMHSVDLVTSFMSLQNSYYHAHEQIIAKIRNYPQLLDNIAYGLYKVIQSGKYSFVRNKSVLPFHRVFSMVIFAMFRGRISDMSVQGLASTFRTSEHEAMEFIKKMLRSVLYCCVQFAESYTKQSYFVNYLPLYVRSGIICSNFDFFLLKQIASMLKKLNVSFEDTLGAIFKEDLQQITRKKSQTQHQFITKWIYLFRILAQASISQLSEVRLCYFLQIQNTELMDLRKSLFISILKQTGPVSRAHLQQISKLLMGEIDDEFLFMTTDFNKQTKTYAPKPVPTSPFVYSLHISLRKTSFSLIQANEKITLCRQQQALEQNPYIETILPTQFMHSFVDFVIGAGNKPDQAKSNSVIYYNFMHMLHDVSLYDHGRRREFQKMVAAIQVLNFGKIQQENNKEEQEAVSRLHTLRKKSEDVKLKLRQKLQKFMENNKIDASQKEPEQQLELSCLICKDKQKTNNDLCYLGCIADKQSCFSSIGCGFTKIYKSCFHTAHYSCFKKQNKNIRSTCPLCASITNILLPVETKMLTVDVEKILIGQFQTINRTQQKQINRVYYDILNQLLQSLADEVGFVGIVNPSFFARKKLKVCQLLLQYLKLIYNKVDYNQKQEWIKAVLDTQKQYLSKENNQEKKLLSCLKQCVTNSIINQLKQQPFDFKSLHLQLHEQLHCNDLSSFLTNLSLLLSVPVTIPDPTPNLVPTLTSTLRYFQPPLCIAQLLQLRDQLLSTHIKNSHTLCICMECSKPVCLDCKTLGFHAQGHGFQSLYFNLINGTIISPSARLIKKESLYENDLGMHWSIDRPVDGYEINGKDYWELVENLKTRSCFEFIRAQGGKNGYQNFVNF